MAVYYVVCDDDCRYEGMTKEQILTAIEQAVAQGHVSDPDNAVFSKIKEIRANEAVQIWKGTEAQFNALDPVPSVGKAVVRVGTDGVLYLCTDDTTFDILNQVEDMRKAVEAHAASKNNPHGVTAEQVGAAEKDHTHTPASIGAAAASHTHTPASIGAVSKTGDTITGKLYFKTDADSESTMTVAVYNDKVPSIAYTDADGNRANVLAMQSYGTELGKPLLISSGGTGATSKEDALAKLGAAPTNHGHNLVRTILWSGSAGNDTTIALNDSIWNYDLVFVSIGGRYSDVQYVNSAVKDRGFSASTTDSSKNVITRSCGVTFSDDGTSATVGKSISITHTPGSNHGSASDLTLAAVCAIKIV